MDPEQKGRDVLWMVIRDVCSTLVRGSKERMDVGVEGQFLGLTEEN